MKKLPVVIVEVPKQADKVKRLVDYCYDLDCTSVTVLDGSSIADIPYPQGNNAALKLAAHHFKGKPFIWLEPDAITLKPNWQSVLSDDWGAISRSGVEFMLSPDKNPPLDLIGGIGVYGPNVNWLIPDKLEHVGFDGWILKHMPQLIGRSGLIQHSYGVYRERRATPHRFPRDKAILRDDAVIFHADKYQDLITQATPNRFLHSGDLGDIIAALPTIRQMGGGELVITDVELPVGNRPRGKMKGERFESIKPLLEQQPYIYAVEFQDEPEGCFVDMCTFRHSRNGGNLAEWHAAHMKLDNLDLSPWLAVDATPDQRIVVARTARYHNPDFPWSQIVKKYGSRLVFIGMPDEHVDFEAHVGRKIDRAETKNLLEVAQLIGGSPLGFYNQSVAFWIAAGLGRKLVQETCVTEANSIVPRENAYYTEDSHGIWKITAGLAIN